MKKRNTITKSLMDNEISSDIESHEDLIKESMCKSPVNVGWAFSVRLLGILTIVLLGATHILSAVQCYESSRLRDMSTNPIVTRWRVSTTNSDIDIKQSPVDKYKRVGKLHPGEIVEAYGNGTARHILLIHPMRGFALRKGKKTGKQLFEKVVDDTDYDEPVSSTCPLLYSGWWPKKQNLSRYLYAPTVMVIAQQFWNAMQVLELLLLISIAHSYSKRSIEFVFTCILAFVVTCLLPFSHYFTSYGGSIFSCATLITCIWAIISNSRLVLSIGDKLPAPGHRMVISEELIAFLCNVGCTLYNYNSSRRTWPYWNKHFFDIDKYFGLVGDAPPGTMSFYTMGMSDIRVPMYVAGNGPTASGSTVFTLIWSVLPFIYVCYFGCLIILSSRSPYKNIQRGLCLFGIFHFLFFTDVVAYLYGRGFWTPTSELFHWSERWAWRVAILVPIYQNFTNGHWVNGHKKKIVGKSIHYLMAIWGVLFTFQQIIFSDIFRFVQYLNGWEEKTFTSMVGIPTHKLFSYHGALVVMCMMYGFMMIVRFSPYKVFLGK